MFTPFNFNKNLKIDRSRFGIYNTDTYLCHPIFKALKFLIMANHKATKKDVRQSAKRRERNRYNGKTTRNAIRDLNAVTDKKLALEKTPAVVALIDKLAKKGVIHKNKAANLKSGLALRTAKLS